jgi:hypothetical protein
MNKNLYDATSQLMSQQNATVFPSRLIVLLAILVLLVLLIMIMFCSFASQEVLGSWRSGEYFFEPGKGSESSTEEAVSE